MPDPRPLETLLAAADMAGSRGDLAVAVRDVAYASGACVPGSLFFCVRGLSVDGHDFAVDAVERGAVALVVERWVEAGELASVPQVRVRSVRRAMGPIAASFFDHPGEALTTIGITGTNGKTTTTFLLESIFEAAGIRPGLIGTTGVHVAGVPVPSIHTTPEAPDLHRLLRSMVDDGLEALAMEVSSHGLDQYRAGGLVFDVAVFTNLTQDHLDYHGTREAYFEAKRRLFQPEQAARAVINVADPAGEELSRTVSIPVVTYSADGSTPADIMASEPQGDERGISCRIGGVEVHSSLRGAYNLENIVAAFAAASQIGIEPRVIVRGIEELSGVPGRMEPVEVGQPFTVLVDYAHTPDALENVLRAARAFTRGRLLVVVGCGGDRDRAKRPMMGRAATSLADLTILTSDNPRSEDPVAILGEIEPGAREGRGPYEIQMDRREAIGDALSAARSGDVVVIAGKGHETGQIFAEETVAFDDRSVAAEQLRIIQEQGR